MSVKLEKVKAGDVLFDRRKTRMGNTSLRTVSEWKVVIQSVDQTGAWVRWNGNPVTRWSRRLVEKLYTWSMRDPDAEVIHGSLGLGQVISVRKARGGR